MKVLILLLGLISNEVMAVGVSDQDLKTKFVATIQDQRIQGQMQESAEFTKCREEALKSKKDPRTAAEDAATCIRTQLKDPEKAKLLAENLRLVEYGLTPSKNIQDVSQYIANKMYKSLTGVDRNDPVDVFMEKTKFKNMKQVDQNDFFLLYKSQLAKNALFQISAYCFSDFRRDLASGESSNDTSFSNHWKAFIDSPNSSVKETNSRGIPKFSVAAQETDMKKIYENLGTMIDKDFSSAHIQKFHSLCVESINHLCGDGKTDGKACTLKLSLQRIRKAFTDGEKAWADYSKSKSPSFIKELGNYQVYESQTAKKEDSIDGLTTMASSDFLNGLKADKQLDECIGKPEMSKCESYFTEGKATELSVANSSINMGFETEIEKAKVSDLEKKNDEKGLIEYLQANGYLDIVARLENKEIKLGQVADEVAAIFKARREAAIDALQKRVGKRQETEDASDKEKAIRASASQFKEERVRLAQVVLFNNIITSQLSLERKLGNGKTESAGRNTSGLDKELAELEKNSIDLDVFKGIKGKDGRETASAANGNTNIAEIGFIDAYLGKREETTKKPKSP
jgi:hypothetical protein